jgi:hypothetical protein
MPLFTVLLVSSIFAGIVFLAIVAATAVARWRIFGKCGIPSWKALIPFYSGFLSYKLCWRCYFFFITLALFVTAVISGNLSEDNLIAEMFYSISALVFLILYAFKNYFLARKFHKSSAFMIGLILLNPVFLLILGFDDSLYHGNPKEGLPPDPCA